MSIKVGKISIFGKNIDEIDKYEIPKLNNVIEKVYDYIMDWHYHVKTTKAVKLSEHDNKINYMYEPLSYKNLFRLFKKYPFEENDGFIDIGCGKGRVLLEASLHGCQNIYGVDISRELLEYANNNIKECEKKNPGLRYQLFCMNAKNYVFTPDINKVFLYNPFSLKIMIKVLKALTNSIEENPREVTLFWGGPASVLKYMDNIKGFRLIAIEGNIHIYRHVSKMEIDRHEEEVKRK